MGKELDIDDVCHGQPAAQAELARLRKLEIQLDQFLDLCESLTGSCWPQNETTEALQNAIFDIRGHKIMTHKSRGK